ncbi:MAG: hypothetical protein AAB276_07705 [Pseudomonadota bacterium]
MNDIAKDFGNSGAGINPAAPHYAHPQADAIMEECRDILSTISEGKRLLAFADEKSIKIEIITGKEPGYRFALPDLAYLICPLNTKAVDLPEMAVCLGLAIREMEQPHAGIFRAIPALHGEQTPNILFRQMLDITLEMCRIVSEFEAVGNHTKLVDLLEKLGHGEIYKGFKSGKNQEELAKIYSISINAV